MLAVVTDAAATTAAVSWRVACVPAALVAVAVQVMVLPAVEPAVTVSEPEVAEPVLDPVPPPEQDPDVDVALDAAQLKVDVVPTVMLEDAMAADVRVGAATMVKLPERVACAPAALDAVTVQLAGPAADVVTEMEPDVPEPEPVAPVQLTVALVAPVVAQVNVLLEPTVVLALANDALVTVGLPTTLAVSDAVTL